MLTPLQPEIARLTKIHVDRYTRQLEAAKLGNPRYNASNNAYYLGVWKSIEAKACRWEALSPNEKAEVTDAIESGE